MRNAVLLATAGLVVLMALTGCSLLGNKAPDFTNWEPDLSPDGTLLVFESVVGETLELFTLELSTGEKKRLTQNTVEDWSPGWSTNGERIVFASSRDENADIYVLDVETLTVERLTTHEGDDINPSWGIDELIYFNSNRSDVWEIYTIDPETKVLVKITETQPPAE